MTNSTTSFKYAIISIVFLVLCVVTQIISVKTFGEQLTILVGLSAVAAGITAIVGVFYAAYSLREPNTPKKLIGAVINFSFLLLFLAVILANIMDINRALE
jgi:hypothetical protein